MGSAPATAAFARRREVGWSFLALTTFAMAEIPLFFGGTLSYPRFSALNIGIFVLLTEISLRRFWFFVGLLVFLVTRLSFEAHSWLTAVQFIF
jgi:hypothetical protein